MTIKKPFDPVAELQAIKERRKEKRHRRTWSRSKLQRYQGELLALHEAGATFGDLAEWIAQQGRITSHETTIQRFLRRAKQGTGHG